MFKRFKVWVRRKLGRRVNAPMLAEPAAKELDVDANVKIATQLIKAAPFMIEKYRKHIGHTGGMVSNSMRIAYEAALRDVIKLITPKNPEFHGKPDQSAIQAK